jgi:hypothetical protein
MIIRNVYGEKINDEVLPNGLPCPINLNIYKKRTYLYVALNKTVFICVDDFAK